MHTNEGFYSYTESRYIYTYKDHLGNARINFAKKADGSLEITDKNDYYAFGMNHIGGTGQSQLGGYKNFKYNGKELQETGMYDYGARFYMPDVGRWGVVDPLAEKHRRHSPYNYTVNNPIMFIDPDGRDTKIGDQVYTYDKNRDYSKYKGFELSTYEALDYLYSTGALNITVGGETMNIMDEMIGDKKNTFTILEQTASGKKNEFDPNTKSVKFNPSEGIRFRKDGTKSSREPSNDGYNSPSSRLGHEIIHGYNLFSDPTKYGERNRNNYDTKEDKKIFTPMGDNIGFPDEEEEYTTTILGNQMNIKLGEDVRSNYSIFPSPVENVKSTKMVIPSEVRPPSTPK